MHPIVAGVGSPSVVDWVATDVAQQYLNSRPMLDLKDLPMFFQLFHSSTQSHNAERLWYVLGLAPILVYGLSMSYRQAVEAADAVFENQRRCPSPTVR